MADLALHVSYPGCKLDVSLRIARHTGPVGPQIVEGIVRRCCVSGGHGTSRAWP